MIRKFISLLVAAAFLFGQPYNASARQERWNGNPNPPSGGAGFFQYDSPGGSQRYLMRGSLGELWLAEDAIWITSREARAPHQKGDMARMEPHKGVHLKITFPGASPYVSLMPEQPLSGHISLLKGSSPETWQANLPLWGLVRYRGLYPGVDLVIHSTSDGFAWEYEAQDGVDTAALRMRVHGADRVTEGREGTVLQTAVGALRLPPLGLEGGGGSRIVLAGYSGMNDGSAMDIHPAARSNEPAALDVPTRLAYGTFLGGGNWDKANDVAVDASGAAYVVGDTASVDFPVTPGVFDASLDSTDAFVMKLAPQGGGLVYATFIGGNSQENGWSIAVENGVAYIAGETMSANFPVTDGANLFGGETDAFVAALNSNGTGLLYSRLLGGSDQDRAYAVAAQNGSAYLTGITYSADFPGGGYYANGDVFVVKLNANGTQNYAKMTGGNQVDAGFGIAVSNGAAQVTGETWSGNFAGGYSGGSDVFVMNVSAAGAIGTKKLFGGIGDERGEDITVDSAGNFFIAGTTNSSDFPFTEGALFAGQDAVVLKVNPTLTTALFAAPVGGSANDQGQAVALDALGGVVVTGSTLSSDFPVTASAFQSTIAGGSDGFVTRFALDSLVEGHRTFSSYLGGSSTDSINAVAMDSTVFAYVAGQTQSADFPTTADGLYRSLNGTQDAFLAKIASGPLPVVTIRKTTNNQDANEPPGPYVREGDPVTWRYDVTNNGELGLTNVSVTDNQGVSVTCPKSSLASGETMQCSAAGKAIKGQYSNLGTVTATSPYGTTIAANDFSHYFGAAPKNLLVKKTNGLDANTTPGIYLAQGSAVTWTYEITNTGNVDLSNVQVVDDNGTPATNTDDVIVCTIPSIKAGATDTTTCKMQGTAKAGQYTNIAVVTGTAPADLGNVSDSDPSSYFGSAPAITVLTKINDAHITAAPGPYLLMGSPVTWKYEVKNTGNVALTGITVKDDNGTPGITTDDRTACSGLNLNPSASITCSLPGTAASGQYHNTATVTANPPVGLAVTAQDDSFYYGSQPGVSLEYAVNADPADASPGLYVLAGSAVDLTYQVTNTGNVSLSNLVVTENALTICTIPNLAAGANSTCSRSITALSGQRSATATISAAPPSPLAGITSSDAMNYFGASPAMTLVKKTNGQDGETAPGVYVLAGSLVSWSYAVTNTGNVQLSHITVIDDNGTPGSTADDRTPAGCADISLNPGASVTCMFAGTAQVGQYTNIAVAAGSPPAPLQPITASDTSHYFGTTPGVTLVKQTNGLDVESAPGPLVAVGAAVTWTYRVKNTSNVAVDISVVDDNGTPAVPTDDATFCGYHLEAGAEQTCTRTGVAVAGQYANKATVTAVPPGGLSPVTAQDTSHYFGVVTGVEIVKSTNGQDANTAPGPYIHVGDPVNWTYKITNTGNVALANIQVTDDKGVPVTCPGTTLQPAALMTCTASGTAVAGQYENIGTVTASPPAGFSPVTDNDVSHYFGSSPAVTLVDYTNNVDAASPPGPYIRVGQPVTWKYVVTNTGNVGLNAIKVTDSQGVTVTCPATTLLPGASTECTASGLAVAGQYSNTGTVSAQPEGDTALITASDTSYYFGANPTILIVKKTNGIDANEPPGPYIPVGDPVNSSYEITNTGNIDLTGVEVSDETGQVPDCSREELLVSAKIICYSSSAALAGQQNPTGSVQADAVLNMGVATASDASHYYGYTLGLELTMFTNGINVNLQPVPELFVGNEVVWTYEVTNKSNVTLSSITVTDSTGVVVDCPLVPLAPGATLTCSAKGKVAIGDHTNTGTATGYFTDQAGVQTVSAEDTSAYHGVLGYSWFLPAIWR